jgi:hypothetical protein
VCHLVRDDVVRQTREDRLPRQVIAGVLLVRLKVAEQERHLCRVVEGVCAAEGVRKDAQANAVVLGLLPPAPAEAQLAAQRVIEVFEHLHRHGVDHLLMKARVGLGRLDAVLHQQRALVEVDGVVEAVARAVVINHLYARALRPGFQRLVDDLDLNLIVGGAPEKLVGRAPRHGVKGEDAQRPTFGLLVNVMCFSHGAPAWVGQTHQLKNPT